MTSLILAEGDALRTVSIRVPLQDRGYLGRDIKNEGADDHSVAFCLADGVEAVLVVLLVWFVFSLIWKSYCNLFMLFSSSITIVHMMTI